MYTHKVNLFFLISLFRSFVMVIISSNVSGGHPFCRKFLNFISRDFQNILFKVLGLLYKLKDFFMYD